jgi:uncharacterized protein YbaA (DUF1428 family)
MLLEELAISVLMDFSTSHTVDHADVISVEQPSKFAIKKTKLASVKRTCKAKSVINVLTALITYKKRTQRDAQNVSALVKQHAAKMHISDHLKLA